MLGAQKAGGSGSNFSIFGAAGDVDNLMIQQLLGHTGTAMKLTKTF